MRRIMKAGLSAAMLVGAAISAHAGPATPSPTPPFSTGSDGTFGAISLVAGSGLTTIQLPEPLPGGPPNAAIINATTILVDTGATLKFIPNLANTPVYLLATGDVTINGVIDLNGAPGTATLPGLGGPGGFDGGAPGSVGVAPGPGQGPGGGQPGTGDGSDTGAGGGSFGSQSYAYVSMTDGPTYGSPLLIPLIGGSGGGGSGDQPSSFLGGAGGGGALLIASPTKISGDGFISANGGSAAGGALNGGSGGAIRLVAPIVEGNGTIQAVSNGETGGAGRLRIDTLSRVNFTSILDTSLANTVTLGSYMVVFPTPLPRLDVVMAAGNVVPLNSSAYNFVLPFGSPTSQTIRVQGTDFGGMVPIEVAIIPDSGPRTSFPATIDMTGGSPATVDVVVTLPVGISVTVSAWIRTAP